jgi:periplasmic divalent cation tolerance protein
VDVLVCLCTCPDETSARRIADALVGERLAACVTVLPGVHSVYRWQEAIERADETMLLIKTVRERLEPLTARVASLHPYELPELVAVEVAGGLPGYLGWVAAGSIDEGPIEVRSGQVSTGE